MVVNEVPVKELLFALARDASIDADIHPATGGLVTLAAVDRTLDEILDRVARQLPVRYYRHDGVLVVEPDTPVLRSYRIDYVDVARDVRSSSSTATQVAAGGEGQASLGNNSSTDIDSLSSHRFWETIATAVRAIVLGDADREPGFEGSGGKRGRPGWPGGRHGVGSCAGPGARARGRGSRDPESRGGTPPRAREHPPAPRGPSLSRRRAGQRPPPSAHRGDDRRGRAERSPSGRRRLEPARARRGRHGGPEPARRQPGGAAVLPAGLRERLAGGHGAAAQGVRQGPGALEPQARGPEQPDRGAEGDPQHRLLRGERGDGERDGRHPGHREHRHRRADRPGRHHARGDPARQPSRRDRPERAAHHHPRQPLRQRSAAGGSPPRG